MFFNPVKTFVDYLNRQKQAKLDMGMDDDGFVSPLRLNPFSDPKKETGKVAGVSTGPKNASMAIVEAHKRAPLGNLDLMDPQSDIGQHISTVASNNGLKARLLAALLATESEGNPKAYVKGTGAKGLGQLTKIAAKDIGVDYNSEDMFDPYKSAGYAAMYLKKQLDRYGDQIANDPLQIYTLYNAGVPGGRLDAGDATAKRLLKKYAEARNKYK